MGSPGERRLESEEAEDEEIPAVPACVLPACLYLVSLALLGGLLGTCLCLTLCPPSVLQVP